MLTEPKVSIIVPIYNVEPYLKQCVDSLRNQTIREIEIILVDDGSPDGCPQMCDQFVAEDERIKVVHQTNAGVSAARNRGMELASADWLMFVDSDDWLDPWAVEALFDQTIEGGFDIVCTVCGYGSKWKKGKSSGKTYSLPTDLELLLSGALGDNPEMWTLVSSCAKIYRKSCVAGRCRFPEGMRQGEDSIFNLYAIQASKTVCFLDVKIYNYRMRSESVCHTLFPDQQDIYRRYYAEVQTFLRKFHLEERLHIYYCRAVVLVLRDLAKDYSLDVTGLNTFRQRIQLLRRFCQEPLQAEAVDFASVSTMPNMRKKLFLYLFKRHRYGTIMLMCLIYRRLFPNW